MNFEDYPVADRLVFYLDCAGWGVIRRQQQAELKRQMAVGYLTNFIGGAVVDLESAVQEVSRANAAVEEIQREAKTYLQHASSMGDIPQLQQERLKTYQIALAHALRDVDRAHAAADACRGALDTAYLLQSRLGASAGASTVKKFQTTLRKVGAVLTDKALSTLEEGTGADDALDTVDRIDGSALEHDMNELLQGLKSVGNSPDNAADRASEMMNAIRAQVKSAPTAAPAAGLPLRLPLPPFSHPYRDDEEDRPPPSEPPLPVLA